MSGENEAGGAPLYGVRHGTCIVMKQPFLMSWLIGEMGCPSRAEQSDSSRFNVSGRRFTRPNRSHTPQALEVETVGSVGVLHRAIFISSPL